MSKPQNWSLTVDRYRDGEPVYCIRRWNAGKLERLPLKKFKGLSRDELEKLVERMNYSAKQASKEKHAIRSAFLGEDFLAEYLEWLKTRGGREKTAKQEYSYLRRHFLIPMVNQMGLDSPQDWSEASETKWAKYLLSKSAPPSEKSKRDVINSANRFLEYLHKKRPDEVPVIKLEPLSPAKLASIEAQRELDGEVRETRMITPLHWTLIKKFLPDNLLPFVMLGYAYGLRRSELAGVTPGVVKHGSLSVDRQLERIGQHTYLKGKEKRKVPHWYATAADAYKWVDLAQGHIVHPRTLSERFDEFMTRLALPYTLHDLRHTFITRALRDQKPRDVQLAAGHKHISTTMGYAHDDRDLDDEEFRPAS